MSNNNSKQPPVHTTTNNTHTMCNNNNKSANQIEINMVEISSVKQREKNGSLGVPAIKASSSTTIIDGITEVNQTPGESGDPTIRFLLDCVERGRNRGEQLSPSICMVSRILRDDNESSFNPQLVSIGPIHREDPKLQEFEWQKECYLNDLLSRCDSMPKETVLEECLLKVNTLIPQIKECYAGVMKNYSDVELARMMVMDGCFILEFCFKHHKENWYLPNKMQNKRIAMDLMLLENQVPFSVLQALFDCSMGNQSFTLSNVLNNYLAPYIKLFGSLLPGKISTTDVDHSDSSPAHVLGYLHKRYQLVAKSLNPIHAEALKPVDEELAIAAKALNPVDAEAFRGHTIVELDRSGMNFKPHQENEWSVTIKYQPSSTFKYLPSWFRSKATLLMPTLVIDDSTELILRNFIAYEQSFPQGGYYFTSYAHAMDKLIDTQEDIAKLVESKVLVNMLVSNQEAADMINKICKNISITDFYYTQEFKQMDEDYNRYWPKKIATMRRNIAWQKRVYLDNPWNFMALIAAIILFSLTVVQTVYAIRAA